MSEEGYFFIGVEIELIAEPHKIRHPLRRRVYYEKLATSLRYYDLKAKADDLKHKYRKHREHYDKWFITKDGSLGDPSHPAIPLEAVSPILRTDEAWESEIDTFWHAFHRVFHMPRRSRLCGSHIHISPGPYKCFSLEDLKSIACGIVYYAQNLEDVLPASRREHRYCRYNWSGGSGLGLWYEDGSDGAVDETMERIGLVDDERELKEFMQDDRRVLWNFEHVLPGSTGTVEFRGGRGLRGPVRTKWWVAFVTAFINLCAPRDWSDEPAEYRPSTDEFWSEIRRSAKDIYVDSDLPRSWRQLNESASAGDVEDVDDSDFDDSDASSIISKAASLYSDSDCDTSEEEDLVEDLERQRRRDCVIL